jgi:hypothetical protein
MKTKLSNKIFSVLLIVCMMLGISGIQVNAESSVITNNTKFERFFNASLDPKLDKNVTIEANKKHDVYFRHSGSIELPVVVQPKEVVMLIDTSGALYQQSDKIYPFDYCLYSGNTDIPREEGGWLTLQGQTSKIAGKVHSNSGVEVKGQSITFYENDEKKEGSIWVEYVTDKDVNAYSDRSIGNHFTKVEPEPLPDIKEALDEYVEIKKMKTYKFSYPDIEGVYSLANEIERYKKDIPAGKAKNFDITYQNGVFKITGDAIFTVIENAVLDFNGSVQFYSKGMEFNSFGMIVAKNDIEFGGDVMTSSSNEAFFYSAEGNIRDTADAASFTGTLYAPNGKVTLQGGDVNITGSILANQIEMTQSNNSITYNKNSEANKVFEQVHPKPTYYDQLYEGAKAFIKGLVDDIKSKNNYNVPVKVGILTYDSTANNDNYTNYMFYDEKGPKLLDINGDSSESNIDSLNEAIYKIQMGIIETVNKSDIIDPITKKKNVDPRLGKSNLGDGLRRAESFFSNGKNVSKTVIVFSGSSPNTWTVDNQKKAKKKNNEDNSVTYFDGSGDVGSSTKTAYVWEDKIKIDSEANTDEGDIRCLESDSYNYALTIGNKMVSEGIMPVFINYMPNEEKTEYAYKLSNYAFNNLKGEMDKSLYYDAYASENILSEIISNVTKVVTENKDINTTLELLVTIPESARFVDRSDKEILPIDDTNITSAHKFKLVKDITLKYDKTVGGKDIYKIPDTVFSLKVKYLLKSKVTNFQASEEVYYWANSENVASFDVKYFTTDGLGEHTDKITSSLKTGKVTVTYMAEIA